MWCRQPRIGRKPRLPRSNGLPAPRPSSIRVHRKCTHHAKECRSPSRNESSIPRVARCRRSRSRKTWRNHMVGAITTPRSWTHRRRSYRRARHRSRWPRRFCRARSCGVSGCAQSTGAARPSVSAQDDGRRAESATALRRIVSRRWRRRSSKPRHDGWVLPMHMSSKRGKAMACRIAISFAAVAMGISCIATDASATCKFKAKKDIIVILDVGHTDKDSGQISARGVKEYDFNMNLARRVLEELVNTGFISTQMIVISGSNTHESRLQRSKRANDMGADLFISIHHDGVKNETRMPWQYNGKTHWFLDKFEGFSLWVSKKNNKYEESLSFAKTLADRLMASGLKFTTHHDELTNTAKYGRIAPLVDRGRGIYDAYDNIAVLYESRMPAVLLEAGMIVNRAEEQVLSSPTRRATVARAVAGAVERFCAVRSPQT